MDGLRTLETRPAGHKQGSSTIGFRLGAELVVLIDLAYQCNAKSTLLSSSVNKPSRYCSTDRRTPWSTGLGFCLRCLFFLCFDFDSDLVVEALSNRLDHFNALQSCLEISLTV